MQQIDGNADYDLLYTRKYVPTSPVPVFNKEEIRAKGDIPMKFRHSIYTITRILQ